MAQTRFSSDALRIQKKLEVSSFEGRYALTTPGPGINLTFREDPYIRLQKFGANIMTNTHNVENDLMGRNRIITRDIQEYTKFKPNTKRIQYKSDNTHTTESRSDLPAWTIRDIDNKLNRFENPWINPQANIDVEFPNNIQTRLQEKIKINKNNNNDNVNWNALLR